MSWETVVENCVCDVIVFDDIAVTGSCLVISLAHGFKCANDLLASNANFQPILFNLVISSDLFVCQTQ